MTWTHYAFLRAFFILVAFSWLAVPAFAACPKGEIVAKGRDRKSVV